MRLRRYFVNSFTSHKMSKIRVQKRICLPSPLTTNNDLATLTDIAVKTFILPISPTVFCFRVANNVAQGVPHVLHNRFSLLNEKYLQCSLTFLSLEPSALNSLDTKVTVRRKTLKTYLQRTFSYFFLCRYSGQTSFTHEILPKANDALVILDPQNRKLQSNSIRTEKKGNASSWRKERENSTYPCYAINGAGRICVWMGVWTKCLHSPSSVTQLIKSQHAKRVVTEYSIR